MSFPLRQYCFLSGDAIRNPSLYWIQRYRKQRLKKTAHLAAMRLKGSSLLRLLPMGSWDQSVDMEAIRWCMMLIPPNFVLPTLRQVQHLVASRQHSAKMNSLFTRRVILFVLFLLTRYTFSAPLPALSRRWDQLKVKSVPSYGARIVHTFGKLKVPVKNKKPGVSKNQA